ncbi:hypothetical protein Aeh1ORF120c [Aeromonas phage Aeh1]|uniref:Uncharacterized protein n=1 Tax=Aeromonas phage Aeh1 TaxID=2880362 RepID=Q76YW4_9CAUD|nr:hypothetical protein Aeh1p127 [Aeromonas phage Aeh1]AAQ17782.1 hypothetical protein Aeh1ORF120c [Aeromonas phage Aeh1]
MSKNFIHTVIVGLAVAAAAFGCTQRVEASEMTETLAQIQLEKVYIERNTNTDVTEYGMGIALPADYFMEVKHETNKHTAGVLGKSLQVSDDFTFVPSVEYGIFEGDNTDHETYVQGIVEYMPFAQLYTYAGAGYSFMNEGQDYSKVKAGVSYDLHPEMTVGYNYTRKGFHERTDFDLGMATENEHEVALTFTGHMIQPYVKMRHTVTTGVGYDNSAVLGAALVF